ncbi:MAG: PDZ domain-containing protein, partial [Calditrichia bacterium]|nr:PDZ domain-containing protein [Calditrichia bacterium]
MLDSEIVVISPIVGSPAYKAGLKAGDKIIEIEGESAKGLNKEDVPAKLKGPKGTEVKVKIKRMSIDKPIAISIIRDVIPIKTV